MHTPMGEVGGPKGIHEHVFDTLHTAAGREEQLWEPLEQVIIGMGSSRTGMHQPGSVVLNAEPHHWQHLEASHSSEVARVQLSLGAGGTGALRLLACFVASFSMAADLRTACFLLMCRVGMVGAGVAGGALQASQSYMQMPAPVGSRGDVGIHLQLSMQVVLTKLIAQEDGTLSHTRLVATGNTGMHQPMGTTVGAILGPHQLQHLSDEQSVWLMCSLQPIVGAGAGGVGASNSRARALDARL
mmetsp:Transcript_60291/g.88304  ORF Transcript_60291/g.88304 Transcript_60291/m.88304 type:complete len:243 (+) Transcript_60291:67-795(+)